ncbi:uncharacterized protein K452DRAFT_287626 [Aplosporella prunicola CBS 121167]|uniref:AA1-like domain-containing protein n=1 Tax=Aplosporella prunicola CBS 121167 TaxID=1176127 RepID=A0A6A6BEH4_9PEZI|nr:uncharacterized protein K452DRAFT_287626 [Aplosporella prunicola CBS 121167]KAF2141674.1 hypothetical protein K452DRAFT_287626 [Aplosporella prunicola CBS 121167]
MRFFAVAVPAVFGALAFADQETVTVKDLTIRDNNGIQMAEFSLQEPNVKCSGNDFTNGNVVTCGESKYRFTVTGSNSDYKLTLYHETGLAAGRTGSAKAPVYCHAGGNGQNDFVCSQVDDLKVTLDS